MWGKMIFNGLSVRMTLPLPVKQYIYVSLQDIGDMKDNKYSLDSSNAVKIVDNTTIEFYAHNDLYTVLILVIGKI